MADIILLLITPNAEELIEQAGRVSHASEPKGQPGELIRKLIKWGHLSVLEHASATFLIKNISRAATHQLVRHRLCSYTQRSQRYVKEAGFTYIVPPSIEGNEEARLLYEETMRYLQKLYSVLLTLGIPKEDARFVLPNACASQIVVTANFRQWRHMIELRGAASAQWEIRRVFIDILKILKERAPNCFFDFEIQGDVIIKTRR